MGDQPRDDLAAALRAASAVLAAAGVPSPARDALLLASFALDVDPAEAQRRAIMGAPRPSGFAELVDARSRRVPLQHLTGRAPFRRLEVEVGPGVFVPRPETEVAVGLVVDHLTASAASGAGREPVVVDLCTGSGAIALAIKDEVPCARVHAVELSPSAFAFAERNRDRLRLDVDLRLGDAAIAFDDLVGAADVVVSNPPYIPPHAVPQEAEVRDHDPDLALYGGGLDGLEVPGRVAARAAALLRPGGLFAMEHAEGQAPAVAAMLAADGRWEGVRTIADLAGRPRVSAATRRGGDTGSDGAASVARADGEENA